MRTVCRPHVPRRLLAPNSLACGPPHFLSCPRPLAFSAPRLLHPAMSKQEAAMISQADRTVQELMARRRSLSGP